MNTLTDDDNYLADLQVAVNTIADILEEEAVASEDPQIRAAWVRAEVGRAALELGVGADDAVMLAGLFKEILKAEQGPWRMDL